MMGTSCVGKGGVHAYNIRIWVSNGRNKATLVMVNP